MMKRNLLVLVSIFLFFGCARVYFANPQPLKGTTVKSFVKDIRGIYADSILTVEIQADELIVNGDRYRLSKDEPSEAEVLVKYYNDFYFASFSDSAYFLVFMGKFYENKLAVYMLNADQRSVDILNRFVKVDTPDAAQKSYLIDPSKKEFSAVIESGLFDVVSVMTKVEE